MQCVYDRYNLPSMLMTQPKKPRKTYCATNNYILDLQTQNIPMHHPSFLSPLIVTTCLEELLLSPWPHEDLRLIQGSAACATLTTLMGLPRSLGLS